MYKIIIIPLSIFLMTACSSTKVIDIDKKSTSNIIIKNNFSSVWTQVKSDPYINLPQYETTNASLFKGEKNLIFKDANRTLNSSKDILPYFDKLVHPNGICFKGIWSINKSNIYSGYFKKGTQALIIARASTALSNTKNNQTRTLGFAGKIFPSMNEKKINTQKSANFFLIDDLGGTDEKHYTNASLDNEPTISFNLEVLKNLFFALNIKKSFEKLSKHPNIRQLYPISNLDEDSTNIITPKYMKIKAYTNLNNNKKDFRNELRITDSELKFKIYVSSNKVKDEKQWQEIGDIVLSESITSNSCDHRLHFAHPKHKDDIVFN